MPHYITLEIHTLNKCRELGYEIIFNEENLVYTPESKSESDTESVTDGEPLTLNHVAKHYREEFFKHLFLEEDKNEELIFSRNVESNVVLDRNTEVQALSQEDFIYVWTLSQWQAKFH